METSWKPILACLIYSRFSKVVVLAKQPSDPVIEKRQVSEKQKKNMEVEEVNKSVQNFSLENELGKLKILVPLTELMKNPSYKESVLKMINSASNHPISNTVNLQEENPRIFIGLALAEKTENEAGASPPFYINLTVHEQMIHNCLLDLGASHNLMPKAVMEALGLSITKPYHDLYAFDSLTVKCLGVIKDMVVSLAQLTMKSVIMDVVVADITLKFG